MSHYALVTRSEPLILDEEKNSSTTKTTVRDNLTVIYESYAKNHPNPRLVEEWNERDRILEQIAKTQALKRKGDNPVELNERRGLGRFFRLWGDRDSDQVASSITAELSLDESHLLYSEIHDENADSSLCGTQGQLDYSCIPQEAHSFARFHMASIRTQKDRPILVRSSDSLPSGQSKAFVIAGIGRIAEFQEASLPIDETTVASDLEGFVPIVKSTSDRDELISYIASLGYSYSLSHVRAVSLGPNFIAISWGLQDGIIVMYRRMVFTGSEEVGWESTAMFAPSETTLNCLGISANKSSEDDNWRTESNLLRVTDIIPIVSENPLASKATPSHVATLAVSRLGATVELVPIAPQFCFGPTLTASNYSYRPKKKRKRRSHEPPEHYCRGQMHSIGSEEIITLNTTEHHADLICLACCKTNVGNDTLWDKAMFPESPPAEHVLVASGTKEGIENLTFWALAIVFESDSDGQQAGFSTHASLIDTVDIGQAGADISVFSSDEIWENWRKPRRVCLRPSPEDGDSLDQISSSQPNGSSVNNKAADAYLSRKTCTLSLSSPIISLKCGIKVSEFFLSALDWHGGVTIIDFSRLIHVASHNLSGGEIKVLRGQVDQAAAIPLCTIRCQRNQFMRFFNNKGKPYDPAVGICWLNRTFPSSKGISAVRLAVLSQSNRIQIVDIPGQGRNSQLSCALAFPSKLQGPATILYSSEDEPLSFLLFHERISAAKALLLCSVRQLDATLTIQSLAQSTQYREALDAVKTLNIADREDLSDVIDLCHKQVWEQDGKVEHLKSVLDDVYVAQQVMSIWKQKRTSRSIQLSLLREASYGVAKRTKSNKSSNVETESRSPDYYEAEIRERTLKTLLVLNGTYTLLCNRYGKTPSLNHFQDSFANISVSELAMSIAKKGDVSTLTLIFLRQRKEISRNRLDVLDCLPIAINPSSYCHLLPLYRSTGDGMFYFVLNDEEEKQVHWSQMPQHVQKYGNISLFVDDDDQIMVTETRDSSNLELSLSAGKDERAILGEWYLARAQRIESCLGNLTLLIQFCDYALKRLGVQLPPKCGLKSKIDNTITCAPIEELYELRMSALQLNYILSTGVLFPTSQDLLYSSTMTMNTAKFRTLSFIDLVSMLLGENCDPSSVLSNYKNFVQPLADEGGLGLFNKHNSMDDAIIEYCLRLVRKGVTVISKGICDTKGSTMPHQENMVLQAFTVCTKIAKASSTTIRKQDRVLKEKNNLTKLVLSVVYDTASTLQNCSMLSAHLNKLKKLMWQLYESLPQHVPTSEESDEELSKLQRRVDRLYNHLITVDLLSEWSETPVFSILVDLLSASENALPETNATRILKEIAGQKIVSKMCKGFCGKIGKDSHDAKKAFASFQNLRSDIEQLNKWCYNGSLPFCETMQTHICRPLLDKEHFNLLHTILTKTDSYWIDRNDMQQTVVAYVNEAIHDEMIQAAMVCQDVLGPLFPEIRPKLQDMRRYLDAASFIGNILCSGREGSRMHPRDIREKLPLDVVECVLIENPKSISLGCIEWEDEGIAKQWNAEICSYFRAANTDSKLLQGHPPFPGGAIFELASILGLTSSPVGLVLRGRIVHHAIRAKYYGASAAVCMSLMCDPSSPWVSGADAILRLKAVASVVSLEEYDDVYTKKELCNIALQRCPGLLPVYDGTPFDTIIRASVSLEARTSRFQNIARVPLNPNIDFAPDVNESSHHGSNFLVFEAADRVAKAASTLVSTPGLSTKNGSAFFHNRTSQIGQLLDRPYCDILEQYGTDLHALFSTLQQEPMTGGSRQSESVLHTTCKVLLMWCISDSVRIHADSIQGSPEQACTKDMLSLGSSLLLHFEDEKAGSSLGKELLETLEMEAASVLEQLSANQPPSAVTPNADIVAQLVSRGYSENGARRSATMTNNENFQTALIWAVTHSQDSNFDDPIMVLKQSGIGSGVVDQTTLRTVQEIIRTSCRRLSAKKKKIAAVQPPKRQAAVKHSTDASKGGATKRTIVERPSNSEVKASPQVQISPSVKMSKATVGNLERTHDRHVTSQRIGVPPPPSIDAPQPPIRSVVKVSPHAPPLPNAKQLVNPARIPPPPSINMSVGRQAKLQRPVRSLPNNDASKPSPPPRVPPPPSSSSPPQQVPPPPTSNIPVNSTTLPKPLPRQQVPPPPTSNNSVNSTTLPKSLPQQRVPPPPTSNNSVNSTTLPKSLPRQRVPPPPTSNNSVNLTRPPVPQIPISNSSTPSARAPPVLPQPSSRYALRSQGKAMLDDLTQKRREMTRIGSVERQHLLREGRKLLEKAKSIQTRSSAVTRKAPDASRYPLRSTTKPTPAKPKF